MCRPVLLFITYVVAAVSFSSTVTHDVRADEPDWSTDRAVVEQLATPLSISWHGTPLARAFDGLAESQRIAIFRDRHVDPGQTLELTVDSETLSSAFEKIAAKQGLGYTQFGPLAYFGPRTVTSRLRTLARLRLEDARELPADVSRKLLMRRSWHWNDLAEPRALIQELADEAGLEVDNSARIPHDLWAESDLPPLSWLDRMTLVAAQFGLTYEFDKRGHRLEFVEIPAEPMLTRQYAGGQSAGNVARRWARELPAAKVRLDGSQIVVAARLEDHERIEQRLHGNPTNKTTVTAGKERYKLAVENTALDKLVDELSTRLGLQILWDQEATQSAGIAADQLVTVKVENADLDDLLKAVFADTGLAVQRQGNKVNIRAQQ